MGISVIEEQKNTDRSGCRRCPEKQRNKILKRIVVKFCNSNIEILAQVPIFVLKRSK